MNREPSLVDSWKLFAMQSPNSSNIGVPAESHCRSLGIADTLSVSIYTIHAGATRTHREVMHACADLADSHQVLALTNLDTLYVSAVDLGRQ